MKNVVLLSILFLLLSSTCFAETLSATQERSSFLQFSLNEQISFPWDINTVRGIRVSIFGRLDRVYGLDVGLFQMITKEGIGVQSGLSAYAEKFDGIQLTFIENEANASDHILLQGSLMENLAGDMFGAQLAPIGMSHAKQISGVQIGFLGCHAAQINGIQLFTLYCEAGKMNGVQYGFYNRCSEEGTGLQLGLIAYSNIFTGCQLGIIANGVDGELRGVDIGLLNFAHDLVGFQFGILNGCYHSKGYQLGIINIGGSRIMPIFNWPD